MKNNQKSNFVLFGISILIMMSSCAGDGANNNDIVDSTSTIELSERNETAILWSYEAEADSMIRAQIPHDISISMVLKEMNSRYPSLHIDSVKVSADTVFVRMDDASYLAQMGSTGNYAFLAEVVYSLTEVPNIKYVNFDFPITDHATPGVYDREYFNNKLVD